MNRPVRYSPLTSVRLVAEAIGIPVSDWPGRCHEIAMVCHKAGCVPASAKVRYGIWCGPISEESQPFAGRSITHHGWVELADGRIYDPTRWVFEAVEPYIWVGRDEDEWYDMGGNRLREHTMDCSKPPVPGGRELLIPTAARKLFAKYLTGDKVKGTAPVSHLMWLGSLPLHRLGKDAKPIYKALLGMQMGAAIPIDNRQAILT